MNRFVKTILVSLIILAAVISPVGMNVAHAIGIGDGILLLLSGPAEGVAWVLAQAVHYILYVPSSWLLVASSFIFDSVVPYSLGVSSSSGNVFGSPFVSTGWTIMRDVANMVFIFALLYIAIMTILRLGAGKNPQALLVTILMIALLVNFSLFFAKVVIDGANMLALEFYKVMVGDQNQSISAIIMSGFNPQKLFGTRSFDDWVSAFNQSYSMLLALYLFGAIVQLVSAYVLFWAAFLFIARITILWILMILSPLAFVAYALPQTQGKFTEWWKELLNQAFVAPIFLFFLLLIALFISGGGTAFSAVAARAGTGVMAILFEVLLGFSLIIAFLVVALKMTKKIGGKAAAMATKASGFALAAAGAGVGGLVAGGAGLKFGAQVAGYAARAGGLGGTGGLAAGESAARVGGAILRPLGLGKYRNKAGGALREKLGEAAKGAATSGMPGVAKLAPLLGAIEANTRAASKKEVEEAETKFKNRDVDILKAIYGLTTTSAEERAGIIKVLGEKGKLGSLPHDSVVTTLETVKGRGSDTKKEIESKYLWQYAKTTDEKERAAQTLSVDAFKELGKVKREGVNEKGEPAKDLASDFFDDDVVFDTAIKNMTAGHFRTLLDPEVRSEFNDKFLGKLKEKMDDEKVKATVMKKLQDAGKSVSAGYKTTLEDYLLHAAGNARGTAAAKDPAIRGFFAESGVRLNIKKGKKGGQTEEGEDEGGDEGDGRVEQEESDSAEANKRRATEEARKAKMTEDIFGKPAVPPTTPST